MVIRDLQCTCGQCPCDRVYRDSTQQSNRDNFPVVPRVKARVLDVRKSSRFCIYHIVACQCGAPNGCRAHAMPLSSPCPCMLQGTFLPRPTVGSAGPARPGTLRVANQQRSRGWRTLWGWLRCRLTPGMLCKLLASMVALLVVMHATSCGFFFCYTLPGKP